MLHRHLMHLEDGVDCMDCGSLLKYRDVYDSFGCLSKDRSYGEQWR